MNLSINLSISIYLSIYVSIYLSIYLWLHYGYKTLVINFHIHGLSRDAARLPWLPREPGQCAGILHRLGRGVDCGVGEGFEKMTSSKERNTIPHVFQHVFFVLCCFKIWCGNKHLEQKHLFRETMPNMCFFFGGMFNIVQRLNWQNTWLWQTKTLEKSNLHKIVFRRESAKYVGIGKKVNNKELNTHNLDQKIGNNQADPWNNQYRATCGV
jgi:hypothetical protein